MRWLTLTLTLTLETGPCVTSSSIMSGIFHSVKSVGYRLPG